VKNLAPSGGAANGLLVGRLVSRQRTRHNLHRVQVDRADAIFGNMATNDKIQELAVLSVLASMCVGLSWVYDEWMFATVFAAEAAWAAIEAAFAVSGG